MEPALPHKINGVTYILEEASALFHKAFQTLEHKPVLPDDDEVLIGIEKLGLQPNEGTRRQLLCRLRNLHSDYMKLARGHQDKDSSFFRSSNCWRLLEDIEHTAHAGDHLRLKAVLEKFVKIQVTLLRTAAAMKNDSGLHIILHCARMFDFARIKIYLGKMP